MEKINVGIIDDDVLVIELLSNYFKKQSDLSVVLTAESGVSCIDRLEALEKKPDILLIDLRMNDMSGDELLRIIRNTYSDIKCIVLSSYYNLSFMGFMLKTGATAFIPKTVSPEELVLIIKEVFKKCYYFMPDQMDIVRKQLSAKVPKPTFKKDELFSEREKEIMQLICQQKTADEIGEILFITRRTVEGHKNHMYAKTGVKNLAGLVIYAIQNKIIDSDQIILL